MILTKTIKIGTRGSPLALKQATMVAESLKSAHPEITTEIIPLKSAADWRPEDGENPLPESQGGKGLFAKEIEHAILKQIVDCGVHSMKDVESFMPENLSIEHVLPRATPSDVFISKNYTEVKNLPKNSVIGTCSPRRKSLALSINHHLSITPMRGNVQTRLDKIRDEQVDGTFLAMAGLERLNIIKEYPDLNFTNLNTSDFTPACAQGIVGIQTLNNNNALQKILDSIQCSDTLLCAKAERTVLKTIDGSCHTPLGAYAHLQNGVLSLNAFAGAEDGTVHFRAQQSALCATVEKAKDIGEKVARELLEQMPSGFI